MEERTNLQDQALIKSINELNKNVEALNANVDRSNAVLFNFLFSILKGVGVFIGATIVAGIIIYILSKALDSVNSPIIQDIINVILDHTT